MSRYDDFESLEEDFYRRDRKRHRARRVKPSHVPKKSVQQQADEVAETTATEGDFTISYTPARHEKVWLLQSLQPFFDQDTLSDVQALVKGGKEANVYRCAGKISTQEGLIAAKVYRPRMFRNLRNDKMYREGRNLLVEDGRVVKTNDHRIMRAVGKKSAFGLQVAHNSWLLYEYTTLKQLFEAGAAVPQPYAVDSNAILMQYIGDEHRAAPTLHEVELDDEEAQPLFEEVLRNIELMLKHSLIHGDLSAYNLLYWKGKITLIDFPQVTDARSNHSAYVIFQRDVQRVCDYFARLGVQADAESIVERLWPRYTVPDIPTWDEPFEDEES